MIKIEPVMQNGHLIPPCPKGLSREARSWWNRLSQQFYLRDAHMLLLENALRALDRLREAEAILKKDGQVVEDRFGQKKQHPSTLIERDAKFTILRSLKALGMEAATVRITGDEKMEEMIEQFGFDPR